MTIMCNQEFEELMETRIMLLVLVSDATVHGSIDEFVLVRDYRSVETVNHFGPMSSLKASKPVRMSFSTPKVDCCATETRDG
jgi:hypothetical protein